MPVLGQHFCVNSDGDSNNGDMSEEEMSESANFFNFHQSGTEVTVHLEGDKNQITFTKSGST